MIPTNEELMIARHTRRCRGRRSRERITRALALRAMETMQTIALEKAVAMIPDGASLMIGGFMGVGTPERLIDELVRQGKRDLTVIANDTALPGRRHRQARDCAAQ